MRIMLTVLDERGDRDVVVEGDNHTTVARVAEALGGAEEPLAKVVRLTRTRAPYGMSPSPSSSDDIPAPRVGSDGQGLWRNGRAVDLRAPARAVLRDGDRVTLDPGLARKTVVDEPGGVAEIRLVGGPGAGSVHRLGLGVHAIGSDSMCAIAIPDPTMAPEAAILRITPESITVEPVRHTPPAPRLKLKGRYAEDVADLVERSERSGAHTAASAEPLLGAQALDEATDWAEHELLTCGSSVLALSAIEPPDAHLAPLPEGGMAYNRPPRLRRPEPERRLQRPQEPRRGDGVRLQLLAALLPAVLGVTLVLVLGQWYYLLIAFMTPLIMIGQWFSDRRHGRKQHRQALKQFKVDIAAFDEALERARRQDEIIRRSDAPDPAELLLTATGPRRRLWERRIHDPDALRFRVGLSDLPANLEITEERGDAIDPPLCHAVPVALPMRRLGVAGVTGPRGTAAGVVNWLIGQAAALHSPRDLAIVVLSAHADGHKRWGWVRWLPHCAPHSGEDCVTLIGADPEGAARRVAELAALIEERLTTTIPDFGKTPTGWDDLGGPETPKEAAFATYDARPYDVLVVLDGAQVLRGLPGMPQVLRQGPRAGVYTLAVDDDQRLLPEECATVATCGADGLVRLRGGGLDALGPILADQVSSSWCDRLARALAPIRDVSRDDPAGQLPEAARLLDLLGLATPSGSELAARWGERGTTQAVIGVGPDGPFSVDLSLDGPHGLVAGTTGAGKSELLQTLICALAVANRPDQLTFVLIDYKGGAAFKECVRLPHTVGMVSDLDGHLTRRALDSLAAEIRRRERLLLAAGAKDIDDYHALLPAPSSFTTNSTSPFTSSGSPLTSSGTSPFTTGTASSGTSPFATGTASSDTGPFATGTASTGTGPLASPGASPSASLGARTRGSSTPAPRTPGSPIPGAQTPGQPATTTPGARTPGSFNAILRASLPHEPSALFADGRAAGSRLRKAGPFDSPARNAARDDLDAGGRHDPFGNASPSAVSGRSVHARSQPPSDASLESLPRLVLIIDEFAALVAELPDFVSGLVDIARRGRSLGIHLILATQRPAGVVTADIQANTSLRIALRVTEPAESTDVIDLPDAAHISKSTPGRCYVKSGSGAAQAVQTARIGGRGPTGQSASPVRVVDVGWRTLGKPLPPPAETTNDSGVTDLTILTDALIEAAHLAGVPHQPSPWLDPLPTHIVLTLDNVQTPDPDPQPITAPAPQPPALLTNIAESPQPQAEVWREVEPLEFGVTDLPWAQERRPLTLDLEHGGHLLIAGTSRSGRSTALRTLAGTIAAKASPSDVHIHAIDCGSGALLPLVALPHCGAVVTRDQLDRVERLLSRLRTEVGHRQQLLAEAGHASLAEYRRAGHRLPWLVLMLDRWEGYVAAFEGYDYGRLTESLLQLLREGPAVGLRAVVTGDRSALLGQVSTVFDDRLLLRLADPADYGLAGLPVKDLPTSMPQGRALSLGEHGITESQIALLAPDPSGPAQVATLQSLARQAWTTPQDHPIPQDHPLSHDHLATSASQDTSRSAASLHGEDPLEQGGAAASAGGVRGESLLGADGRGTWRWAGEPPLRVDALPMRITASQTLDLAPGHVAPSPLWALLGAGGDSLAPLGIDLLAQGPGAVIAGPSRSGRSSALLTAARSLISHGTPVIAVVPRRSPLRDLEGALAVLDGNGSGLQELIAERERYVVIVDDAELINPDAPLGLVLDEILRTGRDGEHGLIIAGATGDLATAYRGFVAETRKSRTGLLLSVQSPADGDLFTVRLPRGAVGGPPGRGLLVTMGTTIPIQTALPNS